MGQGVKVRAVLFRPGDGINPPELVLLDQRVLPASVEYITCRTPSETAAAIRAMVVRGAPAIGCAAAYGYYMGVAATASGSGASTATTSLADAAEAAFAELDASRPTAVNLRCALERVNLARLRASAGSELDAVLREAVAIATEDEAACRAMGQLGLEFVPASNARILHHCNTGSLATSAYGTALGLIRAAHERDPSVHVWVDETRPRLQGARLTAWECVQEGISHQLIVDSAAASLMAAGKVDVVTVGADRIAANGAVANKIGTYSLSVNANHHNIPFIVVAPTSTIDLTASTGADIPIEERIASEVTHPCGDDHPSVAPRDTPVFNPGSFACSVISFSAFTVWIPSVLMLSLCHFPFVCEKCPNLGCSFLRTDSL
jgi:methylthioribose-1-phosphate isomerase